MTGNMSIRTWISKFDNGDFESPSVKTQCEAGWYDWFCKDESLKRRLYLMVPKIKKIVKSEKINIDTMYLFFKNNCPLYGSTYDDFRICDMETGNVIYTITPKSGHDSEKGISILWGRENDFSGEIVSGSMKDIYSYFGV